MGFASWEEAKRGKWSKKEVNGASAFWPHPPKWIKRKRGLNGSRRRVGEGEREI